MKYLPLLITAILTAVLMFFFMKSCEEPKPPDNSDELLQNIQQLETENTLLITQRDSLLKIPPKIKLKVVTEIKYIDSLIKKDSTFAISEYRRGLQLWDYTPDGADLLTYREAGLGAKIFQEGHGFKLQVKGYEEIILKDNEIISNLNFQIKSHKDLGEIKDGNIKYYKELYEDANAWYHEDWLWLTLGVVIGGGVAIAVGATN